MEIGSFIELELPKGREYYFGNSYENMQIARLNTGRAAIWHAFRVTGCDSIWIPYYQCYSVQEFLLNKGVSIQYYHINEKFEPIDLNPSKQDAVLIVNYYGVMSNDRLSNLSARYPHPIIDNSQAFYSKPVECALNVYSARKFIGVPDGAYVIGIDADRYLNEYPQGYSSDTSLFLLQRIEYGCEGKAYASRCINEERIDTEDIMKMSPLTHALLDASDYNDIATKRRSNFETAHEELGSLNKLSLHYYYDSDCVPMVYPLLIENDSLLETLISIKHFQGRWWKWVTDNLRANEFERWVSRYMVPITIDQRYSLFELEFLADIIKNKMY